MAFWALGKVKNLSEKLNLKDYKDIGSKIIQNYMVNKQNEESQFFDFQQQKASTVKSSSNIIKNSGENVNKKLGRKVKQELSDQQWLEIQLSEYKKLSQMQGRLLTQHEAGQQKRLTQQYEQLKKQLQELQKEESEELESLEKERLKGEIREGKKSIESLIRENVLLREQIQRKKV